MLHLMIFPMPTDAMQSVQPAQQASLDQLNSEQIELHNLLVKEVYLLSQILQESIPQQLP